MEARDNIRSKIPKPGESYGQKDALKPKDKAVKRGVVTRSRDPFAQQLTGVDGASLVKAAGIVAAIGGAVLGGKELYDTGVFNEAASFRGPAPHVAEAVEEQGKHFGELRQEHNKAGEKLAPGFYYTEVKVDEVGNLPAVYSKPSTQSERISTDDLRSQFGAMLTSDKKIEGWHVWGEPKPGDESVMFSDDGKRYGEWVKITYTDTVANRKIDVFIPQSDTVTREGPIQVLKAQGVKD